MLHKIKINTTREGTNAIEQTTKNGLDQYRKILSEQGDAFVNSRKKQLEEASTREGLYSYYESHGQRLYSDMKGKI